MDCRLPIADLAWRLHRVALPSALAHSKGEKCLIRIPLVYPLRNIQTDRAIRVPRMPTSSGR